MPCSRGPHLAPSDAASTLEQSRSPSAHSIDAHAAAPPIISTHRRSQRPDPSYRPAGKAQRTCTRQGCHLVIHAHQHSPRARQTEGACACQPCPTLHGTPSDAPEPSVGAQAWGMPGGHLGMATPDAPINKHNRKSSHDVSIHLYVPIQHLYVPNTAQHLLACQRRSLRATPTHRRQQATPRGRASCALPARLPAAMGRHQRPALAATAGPVLSDCKLATRSTSQHTT